MKQTIFIGLSSLLFWLVSLVFNPLALWADSELFPFVLSFDAPKNATNISWKLDAPAGKDGFVRVENGHFATDKGRIQFWGTNTCFATNFTDKERSDRMADRMARFGINCVRLHHMDSHDIWGGHGAKTKLELDKNQLDKLDYFVAALKKRGIYVNINLHVSRSLDERDGFPPNIDRPSHDKGIDNYYRPFIEANKKYARDLLEHVNPYTGKAYKNEPCVAMIEINNENSIACMWGGWGGLDVIRDPFLADLRKLWNGWLDKKYGDDASLRKAWGCRSVPFGTELLENGDFKQGYIPRYDGWSWEVDAQTDAPISNENGILRMEVRKKGKVDWHPQLIGSGFAVRKGEIYTLEIKARSSRDTTFHMGLRMNHDPWEGLGFATQVDLSPRWQTFRFVLIPSADDDNARLGIGGLKIGNVYEIEYVSLKPGGEIGLPQEPGSDDEPAEASSLANGTIPVIWKKDADRYSKQVVDDFCDFILDVEAKYWDEMYRFLKDEIKVRQPVSGTQLQYGSTHAQARMDYCDIHAYWNHPHFPGRAWDGNNWYLNNRALVNYADQQIFGQLATSRVYGKPFTVSEYNHPYPNQFAAEGLPLLAAFGAFQNWDGIFPFAYSHSNDPEPKRAASFFDTAGNTVQMAHMIACHNLFCDGYNKDADNLARFANMIVAPMSLEKEREIFREKRHVYAFDFSGLGLDRRIALLRPVAIGVSGKVEKAPGFNKVDVEKRIFATKYGTPRIEFNMEKPGKGFASARGYKAWLFTGFVEEGKPYNGNLRFGKTNLGWTTVSCARIDDEKDLRTRRYLLVATGEMLNTHMKIEQLGGDKITVGNRWGKEPVRCEGIDLTYSISDYSMLMSISNNGMTVRCWALDESGNRRQEIKVEELPGEPSNAQGFAASFEIRLKPEYKTIWYEIEEMLRD